MKHLLETGGNGVALLGVLVCLVAGGARVAGAYYLMGFELMTLFIGGMGSCWELVSPSSIFW